MPSGLRPIRVIVMDPAANGPSVELATLEMHTSVKAACEEVRNGGLAGCLDTDDQPHVAAH